MLRATGAGGQILAPDGANASPGMTFGSDPDTGFYRVGANSIGVATAGTLRWTWDANGHLLGSSGRNFNGAGAITTSGATQGIGYAAGAGGAVTQLTSKATEVSLNTVVGEITTATSTLAANTTVSFSLNNSAIAAPDLLLLNHVSGGTAGSYLLNAQTAAGSAVVNIRNITAGGLNEAPVIGFALIKGATS